MKIYYKNRKGDILDIRELLAPHSLKDDELNYVPRIGECVRTGSNTYEVQTVITDLDHDTIIVLLI